MKSSSDTLTLLSEDVALSLQQSDGDAKSSFSRFFMHMIKTDA